jgi:5-methylcytosine-specific restriction enzyme subunit McrC
MAIKTYHICEFGTICQQGDLFNKDGSSSSENVVCLEEKKFRSFRGFILKNQNPDILNTPTFSLFSKNGHERIKVGQHVGVIETPSGIRLEILPKVYLKDTDESVIKTKKIFLKMLRCLKDSPFKNLSSAHLDAQPDFPILEIFISTFVTECESLLNKSIRSDYVLVEENLNFVRGKLLVHQNIKYNFINKMKFYCEFCEFIINTPQNRVLKTTLFKLLGKTRNRKNFTSLNRLISNFDSVDASSNILKDLINSKNICNNNNLYFSYKNILVWCEVFLTNKSFVNFSGDASNTAVLFPMWRIFQDYVTSVFRKHAKGFIVKTIDPSCFLINKHIDSSYSQIKPDLVFDMDTDTGPVRVIIDIKWKLIDQKESGKKNYNLKTSDLYQIFAYGKKYPSIEGEAPPRLVLLYPSSPDFDQNLNHFLYEDGLRLDVVPFDLDGDPNVQVEKILELLKQP